MVNNTEERDEQNKYVSYQSETSFIDMIDHLKPSLRKAPDEIIIHAGTNDIINNVNYSSNIKKIVKLVPETASTQKMKFSIKAFFSKYEQVRSKLRIW